MSVFLGQLQYAQKSVDQQATFGSGWQRRPTTLIVRARSSMLLLIWPRKRKNPTAAGGVSDWGGSLTITYFHTGNPHYHRRGVVSRS
ncbi:hypothetical protein, partial [Paraburkholderia sp. 31.1]|uniref:hypothetical protein n=1 Tax=Paraburkholderia sp. 31.1 TaxID=2615205 RepID=UPI001CA3A9A9